jgi:hypothetical protein
MHATRRYWGESELLHEVAQGMEPLGHQGPGAVAAPDDSDLAAKESKEHR